MRTTIRLDEHLLTEAKRYARENGRTLTDLIEESLRQSLALRSKPPARRTVELPTWGRGGLFPGIDLDSNAALLDVMDETR